MFIKDNKIKEGIANGSLRDRFIRDVNKSLIIIKTEIPKEEILRKELLERIKKGELMIPA